MQSGLDRLGCFQVIAVHGDRLRSELTQAVQRPIHPNLEPWNQDRVGHFLLVQAKETLVVLDPRVGAQ